MFLFISFKANKAVQKLFQKPLSFFFNIKFWKSRILTLSKNNTVRTLQNKYTGKLQFKKIIYLDKCSKESVKETSSSACLLAMKKKTFSTKFILYKKNSGVLERHSSLERQN